MKPTKPVSREIMFEWDGWTPSEREIMFEDLLAEWLRDQHPYWYERYSQSRFYDIKLWLLSILEDVERRGKS